MIASICKSKGCSRTAADDYCERHSGQRKPDATTRPSACRRGYDARWRKFRLEAMRTLIQEKGPFCCDCGRVLRFDRTTHVDHIITHRGQGDPLFWDITNLQLLCQGCHSRKTAREGGG